MNGWSLVPIWLLTFPWRPVRRPSAERALILRCKSRAEIVDHLQGVPMSMVSIAPNVLEKMADDANVRAAVLRDVDIYVKK